MTKGDRETPAKLGDNSVVCRLRRRDTQRMAHSYNVNESKKKIQMKSDNGRMYTFPEGGNE